MNSERKLLREIKKEFGWPVDTFRYHLGETERFWDDRGHSNRLVPEIEARIERSLEKLEQIKPSIKIISRIPWVQAVLVTGSVASLNAQENDDIDIWLVVSPRRIWLTRTLDFLIFTWLGQRRLAGDGTDSLRVKGKLCFNMYSTTKDFELPQKTISYAIQFVDAIPVYIRYGSVYEKLILANQWISNFFPSWFNETRIMLENVAEGEVNQPSMLTKIGDKILDVFEYIAGFFMIAKAEKKITVSRSSIFRNLFTTWGTPRILSKYDNETITQAGKKI